MVSSSVLSLIQQQVAYHQWATREMWRGIALVPEAELSIPRGMSFGSILATLSHMYAADRVWINRLSGKGTSQVAGVEVPTPSLLEEVWHDTLHELCFWTDGLSERDLFRTIQYVDSSGSRFNTPAWQIPLHLVNHGTGHRGQVNGMIRQAGIRPSNTDLIQFFRNCALKRH